MYQNLISRDSHKTRSSSDKRSARGKQLSSESGTGDSYTLICFLVVAGIFAVVMIVKDWVKTTKDEKVYNREKVEYDRRIKERHQSVKGIWEK